MATNPGTPRNVVPLGLRKDPTVTQNIRCLWQGGGAALIQTK